MRAGESGSRRQRIRTLARERSAADSAHVGRAQIPAQLVGLLITILLVLPGVACDGQTTSDPSSTDSTSASQTVSELGPEECSPEPDGTCPEGCNPVSARPIDVEEGCVHFGETRTLCTNAEGGVGALTCALWLETGVPYSFTTSGWDAFAGWGPCPEEAHPFIGAQSCEPLVITPPGS